KVKGVDTPLAVMRLRGKREKRGQTAEAPLLGRHSECAALAEAFAALAASQRRVVLLEGEAGIGKSRLAAHALGTARAHNVGSLVGSGDPLEVRTPFFAWRAALAQVLGVVELDGEARRDKVLTQLPESLRGEAPLLSAVLGIELPVP